MELAVLKSEDTVTVDKFLNLDQFTYSVQELATNGDLHGVYYDDEGDVVAQDVWGEVHKPALKDDIVLIGDEGIEAMSRKAEEILGTLFNPLENVGSKSDPHYFVAPENGEYAVSGDSEEWSVVYAEDSVIYENGYDFETALERASELNEQ